MKRFYYYLLLAVMVSACTPEILPILQERQQFVSSPAWEKLNAYPIKFGRNDDVSFVTPQLGWTINSQGYLHKTTDGGETWKEQFRVEDSFFRCLVFKDSLNGWLGTLGTGDKYLHSTDPVTLYETHDGGESWSPTVFEGDYPEGMCSLHKVNDEVIVGCGRVRGPSYLIKTVNGGETWESKNLNHVAGSLVAVHFFDENRGILIGGTTRDKIECRSLILSTEDGGNNWDTLYISEEKGEYLWKISFPTEQIGYISVQKNQREGAYNFLKSTDGGKTWKVLPYADKPYRIAQGIGFLNKDLGWIGGSFQYSYETRDGGKNWHPISTGRGINKFQFLDDTTAFMVGRGIYKLNSLEALPNGKVQSKYDNGVLQSEKNYKNGILDGISKGYFPSGKMEYQGKYKDNLKQGKWRFYNENGTLKETVNFMNGIAKVATDQLKIYEGVYKINEKAVRYILYKDGQLYSKRSDQSRIFKIYPESQRIFFYEHDVNLRITFVKDETQRIAKSITYRPGQEWVATRLYSEEAQKGVAAAKKEVLD